MITQYRYTIAVTCIALSLLLAACAGTGTRLAKTLYDSDYKRARFSNVLVVAAADNYDARAQYERSVVAMIRKSGAEATAFYSILGRNPSVTVSEVNNVIRARGFDSVLFTRVKDSTQKVTKTSGQPDAEAVAKGGSAFDLFRYDYKEYDRPENVRVSTDVVLLTEFYDAAAEKKIWAVETPAVNAESVGEIIDGAAVAVVKALRRDGLVGKK